MAVVNGRSKMTQGGSSWVKYFKYRPWPHQTPYKGARKQARKLRLLSLEDGKWLGRDQDNTRIDNLVSWVCIFILFNPLASWCSQMTFKSPGTGSGGSLRPDAWRCHLTGPGEVEASRGWGGAALHGPQARGPQVPNQAPPWPLRQGKTPAATPQLGPAQPQPRTGRRPLLKPLETSNGYTTPAQRRLASSLTAHPPAPPVSPSSSHHSTLLSPRLLQISA